MKTLHFEININATKEKVWDILWNDATYTKWTSVFCEGSHAISDWKEGSKILFLDGKKDGMFSTIAALVPNELMSIKHLGMVKNGKEMEMDKETESWSGAKEIYTLKEAKNNIKLLVDVDITEDHAKFFNEAFPKGLQKVKELSEA
ncbi:MAG: SRPBCC domain-containing protein [Chitinophagaceae bacterium]|nr:SRPBCC domain-containing protein [Chitinophagaceae bacterium]